MLRMLLLPLLAGLPVCAQAGFEFADFSTRGRLSLVKDAALVQSLLRLTPAAANRRGAAWHKDRQPVARGFETTFRFRITEPAGNEFGGTDGFAFVVQDHNVGALGDGGANGGFSNRMDPWSILARGMPSSVAVFFDTYANQESHDPSDNAIAVYTNGRRRNLNTPEARVAYTAELPCDLKDGNFHTARVTYSPGRLAVYLDDLSVPVLVAPVNLAAVVHADGKGWVGFTAATGGGFQNHDILSWKFTQGGPDGGFECAAGDLWCTPRTQVNALGEGRYHIVLPANLEEGAWIDNPSAAEVKLEHARGSICWDPALEGGHGCNPPDGSGVTPSRNLGAPEQFLAPDEPAGALLHRTEKGRTFFSINDRRGGAFTDNRGYFEFDVRVTARPE